MLLPYLLLKTASINPLAVFLTFCYIYFMKSTQRLKIYSTTISSPFGELFLSSDGQNLTGLWNYNQKYHGQTLYKNLTDNPDLEIFSITKNWLDKYFLGKNPPIAEVPISFGDASEFRLAVWNILLSIPYGKVITYGDIAKVVAKKFDKQKMSAQAVGGAVGHNPISIIVPCHRVVGTNRSLTGYAGGLDKKIKLLKLEGVDINKFFVPTKGTAL